MSPYRNVLLVLGAATAGLARAQALKLEVLEAGLVRLGEQKQQLETERIALEAREPSLSDAEKTRLEQLADEIDKGKARIATIEEELRRAVQELSPAT